MRWGADTMAAASVPPTVDVGTATVMPSVPHPPAAVLIEMLMSIARWVRVVFF